MLLLFWCSNYVFHAGFWVLLTCPHLFLGLFVASGTSRCSIAIHKWNRMRSRGDEGHTRIKRWYVEHQMWRHNPQYPGHSQAENIQLPEACAFSWLKEVSHCRVCVMAHGVLSSVYLWLSLPFTFITSCHFQTFGLGSKELIQSGKQ